MAPEINKQKIQKCRSEKKNSTLVLTSTVNIPVESKLTLDFKKQKKSGTGTSIKKKYPVFSKWNKNKNLFSVRNKFEVLAEVENPQM